jgi:glycosyltransferase involved in cell wall biosynthesis
MPSVSVPQVLHLVISLAPGGLERLVVDWTNARNRLFPGSTRIVCLDTAGELAGQVAGNAVTSLTANRSRWPFDPAAVRRLRALLRRPAMVVHSHNTAAWQYGVLACLGKGVRHVHTEHGTNPHEAGRVNRLRNALLWRMTAAVVVVADRVAGELARRQHIPKAVIRVIPNGIDLQLWGRAGEGSFPVTIPPNAEVIGSVGRLAPVKGYDRLIRAFADFVALRKSLAVPQNSKSIGSPLLLLVGDGPERSSLAELARALGISERVLFAGYQPCPRPFYDAMNLFVLSSRSEGLSISLLEAMATGVPAAVTDVGENRVVVDEGRAGVMLSDNEADWASQLKDALSDRERLEAMSGSARARVEKHYSLEATLAGYEDLYALPENRVPSGHDSVH